jgi:hypothetical protein
VKIDISLKVKVIEGTLEAKRREIFALKFDFEVTYLIYKDSN